MYMKSTSLKIAALGLATSLSLSAMGQSIIEQAKLKKATIYFNGSVLEQDAQINLPAGQSEILIRNVAQNINKESLQIGVTKGFTIMNVSHRQWTPTSEEHLADANPEFKEWLKAKNKLESIQRDLTTIRATKDMMKQLGQNAGPANAGQLEAYTDAYLSKIKKILAEEQQLIEKEKDQQIILKRLEEMGYRGSSNNNRGEIVVQVIADKGGRANFELQYIASNARWSPEYEISSLENEHKVNVQFKANVSQNTGLAWRNVPIVLATANPVNQTHIPYLSPWYMRLNSEMTQYAPAPKGRNMAMMKASANADYALEEEASYDGLSNHTSMEEGAMNNEFIINAPLSLVSNGKVQQLTIMQEKMEASFEYLTIPKQSNSVFLAANVNHQNPGTYIHANATLLHNNKYVGKTNFNPDQLKDTLQLAMGVDDRIKVKREKTKDYISSRTLGSKATQEYTFKITLHNQKSQAVKIKVQEQIPLSTNKDLEIELKDMKGKVEGTLDKEKGIITWLIEVPANGIETLEYSLDLKYPKNDGVQKLY